MTLIQRQRLYAAVSKTVYSAVLITIGTLCGRWIMVSEENARGALAGIVSMWFWMAASKAWTAKP
jgi:hypothetical protein